MEVNLCRELREYKEEIVRQMEITEKLTNQYKGSKRSYLEVENGKYYSSFTHKKLTVVNILQHKY